MRKTPLVLPAVLIAVCLASSNDTQVSVPARTDQLGYTLATRGSKEETVIVTIVYDNVEYNTDLNTAWGYSCLVESNGIEILFDTGGEGATLLENMKRLAIDEQTIDAVVLSHEHWDHIGGLEAFLKTGAQPTVFLPQSFTEAFKGAVAERTTVVEINGNRLIAPGIHTTGEVISAITEQAMVVETAEGMVVITGCAHPGIVQMVRRAKQAVPGDVRLVMGGFHLGGAPRSRIDTITQEMMDLDVQFVAPTHCTGELARQCLQDAFVEHYYEAGAGWHISIPSKTARGKE